MIALRTLVVTTALVVAQLSVPWAPAHADSSGLAVSAASGHAVRGRVIVKFKSESMLSRSRILSAGRESRAQPTAAELAALSQSLQARATNLGNRFGLALASGHAIDQDMQVMMVDGMDSATLAAKLASDADVEFAVPDQRHFASRVPNDPLYAASGSRPSGPAVGQWFLRPPEANVLTGAGDQVVSAINAQGAWDITRGHSSVIVAVLDTGIRPEHPDYTGKIVAGYDVVSDSVIANDGNGRDADPTDPGDWVDAADKAGTTFDDCDIANSSWHGTATASLIGAATNNGTGMASVGWNVRVMPIRVLGKCFGNESDILAGMRWAAGLAVPGLPLNPNPAKVINMSLGREGSCGADYTSVINEIVAAGGTIVASAGNGTGHAVNVPAKCPGVIGVAGVRHIGTKVGFSDVGPEVAIAAPGGNCVNDSGACLYPLLSASNAGATTAGASIYFDSFFFEVGTSFSAPLVSGTVALMRTANRSLTPAQITTALQATARAFPSSGAPADSSGVIPQCHAPNTTDQIQCYCTTTTCGAGLLDTAAAVAAVAKVEAYIDASVTTGTVNQAISFASDNSVAASGKTIVSTLWTLVSDGGGVVPALSNTSSPTLTVTPVSQGQFTVRLTVTDSDGATSSVDQTMTVGAVPTPPASDDSGGGALGIGWLAALAAAVVALSRVRRREP